MKKIVLSLAMLLAMTMSMTAQQQEMNRSHRPDGKDRIEHLSQELNLTPDQREKVNKIFQEESKKMHKKGEDMRKEREKTHNKLMKVLTADQQEKYRKMMEKRGERRHGMRPDGKPGMRPDGKRGMRPDGKRGPRPDGKRTHMHDGKRGPRPDGQQVPPTLQEGAADQPVK